MQINLTFETPISSTDLTILQALAGTSGGVLAETTKGVEAPEAPKPAAKKAAAPAAKKAAEPEKVSTPLEEAVAKATALVGAGKHLKVKAALAEVSVARVSQLTEGDVEAFLEALDAADDAA